MSIAFSIAAFLALPLAQSPQRPPMDSEVSLRRAHRFYGAPRPHSSPSTAPGSTTVPTLPGVPAQPATGPGVTFVDGGGHDYGYSVASDGEGNVVACGWTQGPGGDDDILVVRFDAWGNELWKRTYAGSAGGNDAAYQVALDGAGNILVAGATVQIGSSFDVTLLKYDAQGNLLWDLLHDGAGGYDNPLGGRPLAIDSQGNALVTAYSWGGGATQYDGALLKVAPEGTLLWEHRFDRGLGLGEDYYGVKVDAVDNIYVGGDAYGPTDSMVLHKLAPDGTPLWERTFDAGGHSLFYAMDTTSTGNVVTTGFVVNPATDEDFLTLCYDSDGNLLWDRQMEGGYSKAEVPFSVACGPNGSLAVVGFSQERQLGSAGFLVVYDATGNLLGQDRVAYGGTWFTDVAFDAAGNLNVVGRIDGFESSAIDATVRRYTPAATLLSESLFDNACHAQDILISVVVDDAENVFAVGSSMGSGLNVDLTLHRMQ